MASVVSRSDAIDEGRSRSDLLVAFGLQAFDGAVT